MNAKLVLQKFNTVDTPLARMTKNRKETEITNIRIERGHSAIKDTKKIF